MASKPNTSSFPEDLRRERVIPFAQGCKLAGISVRQAQRLLAEGRFPKPVLLGTRRYGLIVGEVLDHVRASRATERPAVGFGRAA